MFRRLRKCCHFLTVVLVVASLVTMAVYHSNFAARWLHGIKHSQGFVGRRNSLLVQGPPLEVWPEHPLSMGNDRQNVATNAVGGNAADGKDDNRNEEEDGVSLEKLKDYAYNVSLPWHQNFTALDSIRLALEKNLTALRGSIVTKENTPPGSSLHFSAWPGVAAITEKVHQLFPKTSPFPTERMKRCSVIGNSGILLNSNCGNEIDKAEYVFRYMALKSLDFQFQFQNDMKEYSGLIWIPAFANRPSLEDCYNAKRTFQSQTSDIVFGHPQHFMQISKYWASRGVKGILTTGFYLLGLALNLCEETHVFGFWPFLKDPDDKALKFHYYDEVGFEKRTKRIHEIPREFEVIHGLHQRGVLRMHIGKCP